MHSSRAAQAQFGEQASKATGINVAVSVGMFRKRGDGKQLGTSSGVAMVHVRLVSDFLCFALGLTTRGCRLQAQRATPQPAAKPFPGALLPLSPGFVASYEKHSPTSVSSD